MAEGGLFRPPPQLDITHGNVSENYKKWHRQMQVYMDASEVGEKAKKTQTAIILHWAGPGVLEMYDQFTWGDTEDRDDPADVFTKLAAYCNPRDNEVL
jgi:hypothetical protein